MQIRPRFSLGEYAILLTMADEKPLTRSDLVAALKEAGVATQNDLKELRKQVKKDVEEIVHNQLTEFHHEMVKPELDKIGSRLGKPEVGQRDFKEADR